MISTCILIVDDEPIARRLIQRWITLKTEAKTIEAANGLAALEILCDKDVDLIVAALDMPVLNGIEMLSLVRADAKFSEIEVIVASIVANEAKVREVIALGVSDYILKPLQRNRVVHSVQQALARIKAKKNQLESASGTSQVRILIADNDPNFIRHASDALDNQFAIRTAKAQSEALSQLPELLRQELVELEASGDWNTSVKIIRRLHQHLWAEAQLLPLWEVDDYMIIRKDSIVGVPIELMHTYQDIERWIVKPWFAAN